MMHHLRGHTCETCKDREARIARLGAEVKDLKETISLAHFWLVDTEGQGINPDAARDVLRNSIHASQGSRRLVYDTAADGKSVTRHAFDCKCTRCEGEG
jgi:hypothetical protein